MRPLQCSVDTPKHSALSLPHRQTVKLTFNETQIVSSLCPILRARVGERVAELSPQRLAWQYLNRIFRKENNMVGTGEDVLVTSGLMLSRSSTLAYSELTGN